MSEPQPANLGDIDNDDEQLVALWWRRHDLLIAGDRTRAHGLGWVQSAINDRMAFDDTQGTVWLLDRLLEHRPTDDMEVVAENYLDELLEDRGPELAPMIASLASRHDRWRTALRAVTLDQEHRQAVPDLTPYLST